MLLTWRNSNVAAAVLHLWVLLRVWWYKTKLRPGGKNLGFGNSSLRGLYKCTGSITHWQFHHQLNVV